MPYKVPEDSPMVVAAGIAKQLIQAADLGSQQRSITKIASIRANGDADLYLATVRDLIGIELQRRSAKAKKG